MAAANLSPDKKSILRPEDLPPWFLWALMEVGVRETPGRGSTQRVLDYRKMGGITLTGDDSDIAWCKVFCNAAIRSAGLPIGTSALARSLESDQNFVRLNGPALGAIVTFWRGSPRSGLGHTGFYRAETPTHIYVLGGNESDRVDVAPFPSSSPSFGLVGYFWPKGVPLPPIRAITFGEQPQTATSAV